MGLVDADAVKLARGYRVMAVVTMLVFLAQEPFGLICFNWRRGGGGSEQEFQWINAVSVWAWRVPSLRLLWVFDGVE